MVGCQCCGRYKCYFVSLQSCHCLHNWKNQQIEGCQWEKTLLFSPPRGDSIALEQYIQSFSSLGTILKEKNGGNSLLKRTVSSLFSVAGLLLAIIWYFKRKLFESCDHVPNSRHCILSLD